MRDFKQLNSWQQACTLVLNLYGITFLATKGNGYELVEEIMKSSMDITTNIAMGCRGPSMLEDIHISENNTLLNHLEISNGKLNRVESTLILAHDLNFIDEQEYQSLIYQIEVVRKAIKQEIDNC